LTRHMPAKAVRTRVVPRWICILSSLAYGQERKVFCYPDSVVPGRQHLGIGLMAVTVAEAAMHAVPDKPRGGHGRHGHRAIEPQSHRGTGVQRHSGHGDRPQAIERTKEVSKR